MRPVRKKLATESVHTLYEPPTLEEAIFAAQGLTEDVQGQTEIAAALMGLPEDEVRPLVLKADRPATRVASATSSPIRPAPRPQGVVVERRRSRILAR